MGQVPRCTTHTWKSMTFYAVQRFRLSYSGWRSTFRILLPVHKSVGRHNTSHEVSSINLAAFIQVVILRNLCQDSWIECFKLCTPNKENIRNWCLMHFGLLPFTPLQALILLGTFVYFNMSRVQLKVSNFVVYRCTSKDCLRMFSTRSALVRHKIHSSQKKHSVQNAEAVNGINNNKASSLQSSRMGR